MNNWISKYVTLGLVLILQFFYAQADFCGMYNNQDWYCYDINTHCCGFNGYAALCCADAFPFYTLWYFWVGIAAFFFIVSAIAALCRRQRNRQQLEANTSRYLQTAVVQQQTQQSFQNPIVFDNNAPPPPPVYSGMQPNIQKQMEQPPPAYNPEDYKPIPEQTGVYQQ